MDGGFSRQISTLSALFAVAGMVAGGGSSAFAQQAPAVNPAVVAAQCVVCHGPNGGGSGDVPQINNLPVQALKDRIVAARNGGGKPNTIMTRFANGMTDAQVDAAANYFGKK